jgi:peptidoglycan/LPS O-acetylase OafA/YrhL
MTVQALTPQPPERPQPTASEAARPSTVKRLAGIDGLRAAAALWVVLFHIQAFSSARLSAVPGLYLLLRSGSAGVSLFLVLSGFCLYLPIAKAGPDRFKAGQFFLRRCRRLMPAYYVSLVLATMLAIVGGKFLGEPRLHLGQLVWQDIAHATLIHTLFPSSFYALNGAYWSLGLEWQLYLGLPVLIWGISRFGFLRAIAAVILCNVAYRLALGFVVHRGLIAADSTLATAVLPNQLPGRWAEFALGIVAAEFYLRGGVTRWAAKSKQILCLFIPLGLVAIASSGWELSHLLYGCVFFTLLMLVLLENNAVSRLFAWRPLVALGAMSYSLYLVHQPIIQGLAYVIRVDAHASPTATFLTLLALLPLIVLIAWVLFVTVERRTMTAPQRRAEASAAPHRWWRVAARAHRRSYETVEGN